MKNTKSLAAIQDREYETQEDLRTHLRHSEMMADPSRRGRLKRGLQKATQAFKAADKGGMGGRKGLR